MSEQTIHSYEHKASLNQEHKLIKETFGYLNSIDFLVIQYNLAEEEKGDQEFLGFVKTIKTYIKIQNDIIKEKIDNMDKKNDESANNDRYLVKQI